MKSLSFKIALGYFVIIFINILIAAFAIYHLDRLGTPIKHILIEKYQNVNTAENMIQVMNQQELLQQSLIASRYDSSIVIEFHTYKNEFYNWHQKAIEGIALPKEPVILDSISTVFSKYILYSDSLFQLLIENKPVGEIRTFNNKEIIPILNTVKSMCIYLKLINQEAINIADNKAKSLSRKVNLVILFFLLGSIIISVLAGIQFTRKIIKPIKNTTETVKKIGKGHLNQKINISTNDEIAELGIEFNKMTERLDAYEKLNIKKVILEKKKSEAIVANIPVSIIVTDEENTVSLMNEHAKNILCIDEPDWYGKKVADIIKDEYLKRIIIGLEELPRGEADPKKSLITIQRENKELCFLIHQIKIKDEENIPIGIVTILQDVTSFKDLDRLKSDFMANISHEFKTPLTSIDMATDILINGVKGDLNQGQKDLLSGVKSDCIRLKNFIKDLLFISKFEAKKYILKIENVAVKELIEYAIQPLRLIISQKEINLKIQIKTHSLKIQVDFRQLSRVLTNLVENAIQHSKKNGTIAIDVEQKSKLVRFIVTDYGEGIPDEAAELIFDKFVHLKNFKDTESGNIGLGLAIAKEIINAHYGKIWVKSKPGEGSQFYVEIPVLYNENRAGDIINGK